MSLAEKLFVLDENLRACGRLMVAYSGGVDSAYLAYESHRVLGENSLAVIADSPSLARFQFKDALAFAAEQNFPVAVLSTAEMERPEYVKNDGQRCFHCKDELFSVMEQKAKELGFSKIAYGVNADDQKDFRPGQRAAVEHGAITPLLTADLSKHEIRQLARESGLRIWDKPASACLSSRIEYGKPVTTEALYAIERGEEALRELGFKEFRVRYHGPIARIEIGASEMPRAFTSAMTAEFIRIFKALGFTYVTLDLEGFRSGSMNAILSVKSLIA